MARDTEAGTRVECEKCDYEWTYQGQLATATCPSCYGKVAVPQ